MKKIIALFLLALLLSGCATYKFQRGQSPYDKGYVASYNDRVIPEYTIGKENSVPDEVSLAKKRFKRRKGIVEYYYKKMGYIEDRLKMTFLDPPVMLCQMVGGVFHLPFLIISDYRYEHSPKYRAKIDKKEEAKDRREEAWVNKLKDKLQKYIQKDLASEEPAAQAKQAVSSRNEGQPEKPDIEKTEHKETKQEEQILSIPPRRALQDREIKQAKRSETQTGQIKAVIIAKPAKGFSPLVVHFSAAKSYSRTGKIVSYAWDFGDGYTSTSANAVNTYYSGSFEPRDFTATLTVQDNKGNSATASIIIEVLNK